LRIAPDSAEAHNNLGIALVNTPGRGSEAIPHFQAALRLQPGYPDARYNLGMALAKSKDTN
jgi:Flp pilus assembly protein TadD